MTSPFRLPRAPARTDLVAKYFRTLGEPTRLRMLQELRERGELSAGELTRRLGQPQPKISNHLACLRWCGFVLARREHRAVYYRLADARVGQLLDLATDLLDDNSEHLAVCDRTDDRPSP